MDKSYPAKAPMVVRSIDLEKDIFRPRPDIGALMFLANSTRPDIAFAVNLLARHSASPTKRHWVGFGFGFISVSNQRSKSSDT